MNRITRSKQRELDRLQRERAQSQPPFLTETLYTNINTTYNSEVDLNTTIRNLSSDNSNTMSDEQPSNQVPPNVNEILSTQLQLMEERLFLRVNNSISQFFEERFPTNPTDLSTRNVRTPECVQSNPQVTHSQSQIDQLIARLSDIRPNSNPNPKPDFHRWNISFSGDENSMLVDDFLKRIEHISATQKCSMEVVANNFYVFLKGQASNWYFRWVARNPQASWQLLKTSLEQQYRSSEKDCDIEYKLMNRVQKPGESVDKFVTTIVELNSRMRRPRTDSDLIDIMKRNVNSKMLLFIHNSVSLTISDFLRDCRNAEQNLSKIESDISSKIVRNKVSEIDVVEEILTGVSEQCVEEVSIKPRICFDCKEPGHLAINCTKKSNRIFCYKCGEENFTCVNCPKCASKNLRRSGKPNLSA